MGLISKRYKNIGENMVTELENGLTSMEDIVYNETSQKFSNYITKKVFYMGTYQYKRGDFIESEIYDEPAFMLVYDTVNSSIIKGIRVFLYSAE